MRFYPKKFCTALIAMILSVPSVALSQVMVMDAQLNGAVAENNRLLTELLNENLTLTGYTSNLLNTVGTYRNFALDDIRYPANLLAPKILDKFGWEDTNPTILTSPLAAEAFVENYLVLNQNDVRDMTDEEFMSKYGYTKMMWTNAAKNRRTIAAREAVLEGYGIAYAARMRAASTGSFIQDELRVRARNSTSIREDLAVENLALAEIIGQLGTLVAVEASSLEIDAIMALTSSNM